MDNVKHLFASKTFWFGIAQITFAGVGYLMGWIDNQTASSLAITGVGSIGLRLKTSQPVIL